MRAGAVIAVVAGLGLAGFGDVSHVVAPGESLWALARRYATTPQVIARANHVADPDLIRIGATLVIPGASPPVPARPPTVVARPAPPLPTTMTHVVSPGENLTGIASRYGLTVQTLAWLNRIANPNLVRIGQVLEIPLPTAGTVESLLVHFSHVYGVDPALAEGLAWQESGWQQQVVSPVGAVGVMQLMPGTATFSGAYLVLHPIDAADVASNVQGGVAFLAFLLRQAKGNEALAIAGYYQGLRSVLGHGMYTDTQRYVADVEALKQRFSP